MRFSPWDKCVAAASSGRARLARMNHDPYMEAYAERTLGEIMATQEQVGEARRLLEQALALFRQLEIADEVRRTEEQLAALGAFETKRVQVET
jgi:hypothetical protein